MAWICCTLLSRSWTAELSPPEYSLPRRQIHLPESQQRQNVRIGLNLLHTLELIPNCWTVTAKVLDITPGNDGSIFQNRSKGPVHEWPESAAHPWADPELLNCHRLEHCITPGNDGSIFQNRSKGPPVWPVSAAHPLSWSRTAELSPPSPASPQVTWQIHLPESQQRPQQSCGLNLLHTLELIPNCWTVTAKVLDITPGNDGSIFQNRSKRPARCGLNLQDTLELIFETAERLSPPSPAFTPGNDGSIFQNRSKGPPGVAWICLHTLELIPNCRTVTAESLASPQVMTDPSSRIAAKAPGVAWICCTPLSWSRTAELSPPRSSLPQVTTDPSSRRPRQKWLESSAHPWADLELPNCHPPCLHYPR